MKKNIKKNNIEYYIDNNLHSIEERNELIDKISEIAIEEIINLNTLLKIQIEKENYNKCGDIRDNINKQIEVSAKLLSKVNGENEEDIHNYLIMQNDNLFKFIVLGENVEWRDFLDI
jgi:hypothetical protein